MNSRGGIRIVVRIGLAVPLRAQLLEVLARLEDEFVNCHRLVSSPYVDDQLSPR
jgi:hypothetical protein